jgi:hypothetical protein
LGGLSESTSIGEALIVAKRVENHKLEDESHQEETFFINLMKNLEQLLNP